MVAQMLHEESADTKIVPASQQASGQRSHVGADFHGSVLDEDVLCTWLFFAKKVMHIMCGSEARPSQQPQPVMERTCSIPARFALFHHSPTLPDHSPAGLRNV